MVYSLISLFLAAGLPAPDGGNQVTVSTGVSSAQWVTLPDCAADGGNALNYTQSTKAFACGAVAAVKKLSVSVTPVGNVGAGEDNLMTYTLPAGTLANLGDGVRLTAFGYTADNAAAKTVKCYFGSTVLLSHDMDTNRAQDWRISSEVLRTGAATQTASAVIVHNSATNDILVNDATTPAETLANAITLKCTGTATTDNDIVQLAFVVEFLGP